MLNINHLTKTNCNTISLIGLKNYPSFTDIKVYFNENQFTAFTTREIEIIKLLAQGHSTIDISGRFNISEHSVKTHLKNIHKKSDCRNTAELIHKFIAQGVI